MEIHLKESLVELLKLLGGVPDGFTGGISLKVLKDISVEIS